MRRYGIDKKKKEHLISLVAVVFFNLQCPYGTDVIIAQFRKGNNLWRNSDHLCPSLRNNHNDRNQLPYGEERTEERIAHSSRVELLFTRWFFLFSIYQDNC